jgi:hypothetical protein
VFTQLFVFCLQFPDLMFDLSDLLFDFPALFLQAFQLLLDLFNSVFLLLNFVSYLSLSLFDFLLLQLK